jgi:hypothetical protein
MPEVMIVPDDINTRNWCRTVEREGILDLRWLVRRGVSREDAKARRAGGERGEWGERRVCLPGRGGGLLLC